MWRSVGTHSSLLSHVGASRTSMPFWYSAARARGMYASQQMREATLTPPMSTTVSNGQGPLLTVVDIGGVRVASLICWEAYMPLARAALYQKGIDVLLAPTWDNSD